MRAIVVGDVHGCASELRALLDRCQYDTAADALIFAGDLVAKGPRSAEVVALARDVGAQVVRGNHEARVLSWWRKLERGAPTPPERAPLTALCESLGDERLGFLDATPHWLAAPRWTEAGAEVDVIVVHAGFNPALPLDAQHPDEMTTMRSIRADGTVTRRIDGAPWASRWSGPAHVVFGHDAIRGLQRHPHATGLDTGCVYGKQLSALVYADGEAPRLVQVDAERVWCQVEDL